MVHELNGQPAWHVYEAFARERGVRIDDPSGFLLAHILSLEEPSLSRLRVPLALDGDGTSIRCAAEVPEGSLVRIMEMDVEAVSRTGPQALKQAIDLPIAGALISECAANRTLLGDKFQDKVQSTAEALAPAATAGCAGYGQLAKLKDDFQGLMDAASLVCFIPE